MKLITPGDRGLSPIEGDLTGRVLVIAHTHLKRRYQLPRFQLFKAHGGFGCKEGSLGSAVFGQYIADGEESRQRRNDFIGFADDELIKQALADTTPVEAIDLTKRVYLLVAKDGSMQIGDTVEQARQRLRLQTPAQVVGAFLAHPETTVTDMGFLAYPSGAVPQEIRIKKGKEWTAAN